MANGVQYSDSSWSIKVLIIKAMTKSTAVYYDFNRDKQIKAVMSNTQSHDVYLELEHELFSMYYRDYHLWMHKDRYFKKLCSDLFQYHHKRQNYANLRDELTFNMASRSCMGLVF